MNNYSKSIFVAALSLGAISAARANVYETEATASTCTDALGGDCAPKYDCSDFGCDQSGLHMYDMDNDFWKGDVFSNYGMHRYGQGHGTGGVEKHVYPTYTRMPETVSEEASHNVYQPILIEQDLSSVSSTSKCTAKAGSFADTTESAVLVEAVAEAGAFACAGSTNTAIVTNTAEGVAYAAAKAIAETSVACETTGEAKACASAEADVKAVAVSIGQVCAHAFATAVQECGCVVEAATLETELAEAVAEAHAASKSAVCVEGDASAEASNYVEAFTETFTSLYGMAIAKAKAGAGCHVFVQADTGYDSITYGGVKDTTNVDVSSVNGTATADAGGMAHTNGADPATMPAVGTDAGIMGSGDLSLDGSLTWYYTAGEYEKCSGKWMPGCCKHAKKGWTKGTWFSDHCACNFPTMESMEACEAISGY